MHVQGSDETRKESVCRDDVFELVRGIMDPEYPHTLEQLGVVSLENIDVYEREDEGVACRAGLPVREIAVSFVPTVPHCSMAGVIGLCILYRLQEATRGYVLNVSIKRGAHNTDAALNKQLADRDRVMAAFENEGVMEIVKACVLH